MEGTIGAEEFRKRLLAIVGPGGGPGLPRRQRDREIFLRAAAQGLRQPTYSESDLNAALGDWLSLVEIHDRVDHVSLRRYLVDSGYLQREAGGSVYTVRLSGREDVPFESGVREVDAVDVIHSARVRASQRRRQWAGAGETP